MSPLDPIPPISYHEYAKEEIVKKCKHFFSKLLAKEPEEVRTPYVHNKVQNIVGKIGLFLPLENNQAQTPPLEAFKTRMLIYLDQLQKTLSSDPKDLAVSSIVAKIQIFIEKTLQMQSEEDFFLFMRSQKRSRKAVK